MAKCRGCGANLQSNDPNLIGYVPEAKLALEAEPYCQRCYGIIHHNIRYENSVDTEKYFDKLSHIKETKSLVIMMLDVLNLNSSFINGLFSYIGANPVLVLINKIDLLPKSTKLSHLEMYVKSLAVNHNLNVVSVMMVSSLKQTNIELVLKKIAKLKYPAFNKKNERFKDCYVVGYSSVGKSTFINALLKHQGLAKNDVITTSSQFNTTVDFIKIPLDKKSYLYDTPGIINPSSFMHYLGSDSVIKLTPKSYIKNKVFQLNKDQTIFIAGLVQIDFLEGENISLATYLANDLYIHRCKSALASTVYEKNIGSLLLPPSLFEKEKLGETDETVYSYDQAHDLELPGIGFVHLTGSNVKIKVIKSKKVKVYLQKTFI